MYLPGRKDAVVVQLGYETEEELEAATDNAYRLHMQRFADIQQKRLELEKTRRQEASQTDAKQEASQTDAKQEDGTPKPAALTHRVVDK